MTVTFDPERGRLLLDSAAFDDLVAWASGGRPTAAAAELADAGVIVGGRPHPTLEPALAAVTEPVCRLSLVVGGAEPIPGWVTPGAATMLLPLPDGVLDLVTVPPPFLPAALARIVKLGPRRRTDADPRQLTTAELDELLATDGHVRWTVECEWSTASGRADQRRVDVVDHLPRGLWLLEPTEGRLLLWPTTPTAVWRSLTRLLPGDEELAG